MLKQSPTNYRLIAIERSAYDKAQVLTLIIHKARPNDHPKASPPIAPMTEFGHKYIQHQ